MCGWRSSSACSSAPTAREPSEQARSSASGDAEVTAPTTGSILIADVRPYGEGDPIDVLVVDGEIADIGTGLTAPDGVDRVDGGGAVVLPGFVDLHTHLREPGREDTETIRSGSSAAALGGYTAVFAMANTDPVADNATVTDNVWRTGRDVGLVDVHPVGAVTVGLAGTQLAEMGMMAAGAAGVRMFSDDGKCVDDPLLMRRALEYAKGLDVLIAQHAEEPRLTVGAVAHEGPNAARLGLSGWPRAAEESIVIRDALLARDAGTRVHICHASTEGTVELLRWARDQGIAISAEVTPHHLLLDDSRLLGAESTASGPGFPAYDPVNKVNPPLRESRDKLALRQALADGVIDCVATDHAPHAAQEKACEFAQARPGMLGLQTALPIVVETMVTPGLLDWRGVARVMSERPAQIVGLSDQGRPIAVGEPGNLTLVDPDTSWIVDGDGLASLSRNTPYEAMTMPATVTTTVLRGVVTARDGEVVG
ncbi:dihydroorotase [Gordonia hankookensis]|uniref:Dihydroorotase n=1 Tax=Gordonia hankookensis TaxID=589403 RepID=A0ABR7WGJ6_9ACTN|nr:dihydroorotase [Gordonia hankookensis]